MVLNRARLGGTPAASALIVLALAVSLVGLRLALFAHWLPPAGRGEAASLFVVACRGTTDPAQTPPGLIVLPSGGEYDGVEFYRLALNPLSHTPAVDGITSANPPYRQLRILYPALVWALAGGGRPAALPWLLIGINLLALAALAWAAGAYAVSVGRSALWGAVVGLYPGLALSLSLDTAEPLEIALLVAGLLASRRGRPTLAAVSLALAVLARETAGLVAAAMLLVWLWQRVAPAKDVGRRDCLPARLFVVPLAVSLGWRLALLRLWTGDVRFGGLHSFFPGHILGKPLKGLVLFVFWFGRSLTPLHLLWAAEVAYLLALGVLTLGALWESEAPAFLKAAWVGYGLMLLVLTRAAWAGDGAFLRVAAEYAVVGLLILLQSRPRLLRPVAAVGVALWVLIAAHLLVAGIPLRHSIFES